MTQDQKRARIFGVLYLITFVTSIPALALFELHSIAASPMPSREVF